MRKLFVALSLAVSLATVLGLGHVVSSRASRVQAMIERLERQMDTLADRVERCAEQQKDAAATLAARRAAEGDVRAQLDGLATRIETAADRAARPVSPYARKRLRFLDKKLRELAESVDELSQPRPPLTPIQISVDDGNRANQFIWRYDAPNSVESSKMPAAEQVIWTIGEGHKIESAVRFQAVPRTPRE